MNRKGKKQGTVEALKKILNVLGGFIIIGVFLYICFVLSKSFITGSKIAF